MAKPQNSPPTMADFERLSAQGAYRMVKIIILYWPLCLYDKAAWIARRASRERRLHCCSPNEFDQVKSHARTVFSKFIIGQTASKV